MLPLLKMRFTIIVKKYNYRLKRQINRQIKSFENVVLAIYMHIVYNFGVLQKYILWPLNGRLPHSSGIVQVRDCIMVLLGNPEDGIKIMPFARYI